MALLAFTALTGYLADQLGLRTAMLLLVSFFALSLLAAVLVIRWDKSRKGGPK